MEREASPSPPCRVAVATAATHTTPGSSLPPSLCAAVVGKHRPYGHRHAGQPSSVDPTIQPDPWIVSELAGHDLNYLFKDGGACFLSTWPLLSCSFEQMGQSLDKVVL